MPSMKDILNLWALIGWKWKDRRKIFHANSNQKRAGVTTLISDRLDFKLKTLTRYIKKDIM